MGAYLHVTSAHIHTNINSTQSDTLSHRLDTYTLPKPNQTPPTTHSNNNLDTVYILAQLAQRADHVTEWLHSRDVSVTFERRENCCVCIFHSIPVGRGPWCCLVECCFTSTETVGLLGTGAQDVHLDFHTAPELWDAALDLLHLKGRRCLNTARQDCSTDYPKHAF